MGSSGRRRTAGGTRGWRWGAACGVLAGLVSASPAARGSESSPDGESGGSDGGSAVRLTLGLGGGYGFAVSGGLEEAAAVAAGPRKGLGRRAQAPRLHGVASLGLSLRAYFPAYLAAEIGVGLFYADGRFASGPEGELAHREAAAEIPFLAGLHYPLCEGLHLSLLAGAVVVVGPVSNWDLSGEELGRFLGEASVGFAAAAAVEWIAFDLLAVGFELRYRQVRCDDLEFDPAGLPADGVLAAGGRELGSDLRRWALDLSGLSAQVTLRLPL